MSWYYYLVIPTFLFILIWWVRESVADGCKLGISDYIIITFISFTLSCIWPVFWLLFILLMISRRMNK